MFARRRDVEGGEELTHGREHPVDGEAFGELGGAQIDPREEELVLGVEEVEQVALADVELTLVGVAGAALGLGLLGERRPPRAGGLEGVVGSPRLLFGIEARLEQPRPRLVDAMEGLPLARDVRAAAEEVVAHDDQGRSGAVLVRIPEHGIADIPRQLEIEAGIEAGARGAELGLGGIDVGGRDQHRGMGRGGERSGFLGACGKRILRRRIEQQVHGFLADDAPVVGDRVLELSPRDGEVLLRLSEPRLGLADVGDVGTPLALEPAHLGENALVLGDIGLVEFDDRLPAQHFEVCLHGVESDELRGLPHAPRGAVDARLLTFDLAPGLEAVEQELGERKLRLGAEQGLAVVAVERAGFVVVRPFGPRRRPQIERRQQSCPRLSELLIDRTAIRPDHAEIGVDREGRADAVDDRTGLRAAGDAQERDRGEQGRQESSQRGTEPVGPVHLPIRQFVLEAGQQERRDSTRKKRVCDKPQVSPTSILQRPEAPAVPHVLFFCCAAPRRA